VESGCKFPEEAAWAIFNQGCCWHIDELDDAPRVPAGIHATNGSSSIDEKLKSLFWKAY
jgi:hypothetical protein